MVLAGLLHATWNTIAKRLPHPYTFIWLMMGALSILSVPFACFVVDSNTWLGLPAMLTSAVFHGLYMWTLGQAYRWADLSTVYPIARGLGVAFVPLGVWFTRQEVPGFFGALAIVSVVAGTMFVGFRRSQVEHAWRGSVLAVATGIMISGYLIADRSAVEHAHPLAVLTVMAGGSWLMLLPTMIPRRLEVLELLKSKRILIGIGALLSGASYVLLLTAYGFGKTSYLVATRECSIVFSLALGYFVLGEPMVRQKIFGSALILAGVIVLALVGE